MAAPKTQSGPLKLGKTFDHDRELAMARFSPCGKFIFAAGCDQMIYRWSVDGGAKTSLSGHDGWISGIVFHQDGKQMFSLDSWGRIAAWNYADETPRPIWTKTETHKGWAKHLSISPDGATLATCGADSMVRLWSTADGAAISELTGHESPVFCSAFHPSGRVLVSGDLKGVIHCWDLAAKKSMRTMDASFLYLRPDEINDVGGVRCLLFLEGGKTLAASGAQPITSGFVTAKPAVLLFDVERAKESQRLQLADAATEDGFAFDLAQRGGMLWVACSGSPGRGAVWVWKPGTNAPLHVDKTLLHCRSISIHPDGKQMLLAQVGRGGGNGRKLTAGGDYVGNNATVRIYTIEDSQFQRA